MSHASQVRRPPRITTAGPPTGWRRRALIAATGAVLLTAGLLVAVATDSANAAAIAPAAASAPAAEARTFKNCTELNKRYPHGVGRKSAKDKTTGTPVTTFKRSNALYEANKKSDRDKDKIACEKR